MQAATDPKCSAPHPKKFEGIEKGRVAACEFQTMLQTHYEF
jgi:hypothetical protein